MKYFAENGLYKTKNVIQTIRSSSVFMNKTLMRKELLPLPGFRDIVFVTNFGPRSVLFQ